VSEDELGPSTSVLSRKRSPRDNVVMDDNSRRSDLRRCAVIASHALPIDEIHMGGACLCGATAEGYRRIAGNGGAPIVSDLRTLWE